MNPFRLLARSRDRIWPAGGGDLASWRQRILDMALASGVVLGFIAAVPSVYLGLRDGYPAIVIADVGVYAWLLVVTFGDRWSYTARAGSLLTICYLLGVVLTIELGPFGPGLAWMSTVPILAALFFGFDAAVSGLGLVVVTVAVAAVGIAHGLVGWVRPPGMALQPVAAFIVTALNHLILSATLSISLGVLLRGLEESNQALAREFEDRHRAEEDREQMARQLGQAQKLEALGTLAGGIAHDFNNLLVPILANAELIRQDLPPGSPDVRRLDDIAHAADRARDLVKRILGFSRHAPRTRVAVRVDDVAREIHALLRAAVPPMVRIEYIVSARETTVVADPTELHQVLMNLGTNAAYAMREHGGTLTIAVADADEGRGLRLSVYDTGTGMDAATLERAFDPFFTTKPAGEGTGLGLSSVHGIVVDLGGRVALASEVGRGTRVDIVLPRLDTRQPLHAAAVPAAPVATETPRRILLVDDEPQVLDVCALVLSRAAFDVTAVADPLEALDRLRVEPDRFDLLITDHAMPGMTGIALASEVHVLRPALPILLSSGFMEEEAKRQTAAAGIRAVLAKPFTPAELVGAVRAVLQPV